MQPQKPQLSNRGEGHMGSKLTPTYAVDKRLPVIYFTSLPLLLPYMYKLPVNNKRKGKTGSAARSYRQSLLPPSSCNTYSAPRCFLSNSFRFFHPGFVYTPYATWPIGLSSSIPGAIKLVRGSPVSFAAEQRAIVGELNSVKISPQSQHTDST